MQTTAYIDLYSAEGRSKKIQQRNQNKTYTNKQNYMYDTNTIQLFSSIKLGSLMSFTARCTLVQSAVLRSHVALSLIHI